MPIPLVQVDAFSDAPFRGNPAAVCLLENERPEAWMQDVAAEMNLSETAFVRPHGDAWALRWFTPRTEVDLCGHATLATAHALREAGRGDRFRFATRSGTLEVEAREGRYVMDFPALPVEEAAPPAGLLAALGLAHADFCGRSRFDRVVVLRDEREVRALAPDFAALAGIEARGVIVTAPGAAYDFVSRCFYPGVGIDEDPVTGSAHCALAPYWAERLGRASLKAFQASRRGGEVSVEVEDDRVQLGGRAVTVFRAELWV